MRAAPRPFSGLYLFAVAGVALSASASAGCIGGDEATVFPPGVEPLEANRATAPSDPGDPHPERMVFASGETHGRDWTHARAFVKQPVKTVWAAFQDPEVVADRRKAAEWSVTHNVETGFDVSFLVHNTVHDVITVNFDITWRQSVAQGTRAEPQTVAIRFQKTYGTVFIDVLQGSVILKTAADGVTELEMVEHLEAASGGSDTLEEYLADLFASVRERSHGRPLPTYDD